jgi:hypothetical protein
MNIKYLNLSGLNIRDNSCLILKDIINNNKIIYLNLYCKKKKKNY